MPKTPTAKRPRISPTLTGIAGEYLVAGELSRRGYIASITLRNSRGIDILAANEDATRTVAIQVKATQDGYRQWMLNKKAETDEADSLFYVFVSLNGLGQPRFHIVPSGEVAAFVRKDHKRWVSGSKRDGNARKDVDMRRFVDPDDQFLDRWELLGLDTSGA